MKMGLREANQNFAKLVRAVRAGQTVTLTDRGKPLARVEPERAEPASTGSEEEALARLAAQGRLLQRGRREPRPAPKPWKPIQLKGGKTSTELLREEREAR